MKTLGEDFIGNMLAIAGSENEMEIMFHRANNRHLIAEATDEELQRFAKQLHSARNQTEEECYRDLSEWRDKIRQQLANLPKLS